LFAYYLNTFRYDQETNGQRDRGGKDCSGDKVALSIPGCEDVPNNKDLVTDESKVKGVLLLPQKGSKYLSLNDSVPRIPITSPSRSSNLHHEEQPRHIFIL
jgi:hypothetical protein